MTTPRTGQIIFAEGGYDATNVTFYEVIKTTPKTVTLIKVQKGVTDQNEGPTRFVVPTGTQVGAPFTRKVKDYGSWWSVKINDYTFAQAVFTGPVAETAPGWY